MPCGCGHTEVISANTCSESMIPILDYLQKYYPVYITLATVAIVATLTLIPAFFIESSSEEEASTTHHSALASNHIQWIALICLCTSLPAALEVVSDLISAVFVKADIFTKLIITRISIVVGNVGTLLSLLIVLHVRDVNVHVVMTILRMRGIYIISAFLYLMHKHCEAIYTRTFVILTSLLICSGIVIQTYAFTMGYKVVYAVGNCAQGFAIILLICATLFHFMQEWKGTMNLKRSIGYEVICVTCTIITALLVRVDNDKIFYYTVAMGVTTIQSVLFYTAVTVETKWVRDYVIMIIAYCVTFYIIYVGFDRGFSNTIIKGSVCAICGSRSPHPSQLLHLGSGVLGVHLLRGNGIVPLCRRVSRQGNP
jgi:hypothetical protein